VWQDKFLKLLDSQRYWDPLAALMRTHFYPAKNRILVYLVTISEHQYQRGFQTNLLEGINPLPVAHDLTT